MDIQPERQTKSRPDLEQLIRDYGDGLLRMCLLYLHDYQLAEDAVQETYIKAYQGWHAFRGQSSEKTWLMKIAINVCRSQLRGGWYRRVFPRELAREEGYEQVFPDDTVCDAIAALRPKYREAVLLFYYQELKASEIASILGISESAVTVRLSRARRELKQTLKGWYFDE